MDGSGESVIHKAVVSSGSGALQPALSEGAGTHSPLAGETMTPAFLGAVRRVLTCSGGMSGKLATSSVRIDVTP